MAIYTFRIVGVHYAVNPDSTSREEETELMHQRTAQRLRELDEVRPPVVLIPEPSNPADTRAVMARVEGRRIGYVSTPQLDAVHALLSAQGGRPLKAHIESVEAKKHGWMTVCVETNEEVCIAPQNQCDSVWKEWTCTLPVLPTIESQFALMEAEAMLEDVLNRNAPDDVLSKYPILAPAMATQSEAKSFDDIRVDGCVDASENLRHDAPLNGKHGKESVVDFDFVGAIHSPLARKFLARPEQRSTPHARTLYHAAQRSTLTKRDGRSRRDTAKHSILVRTIVANCDTKSSDDSSKRRPIARTTAPNQGAGFRTREATHRYLRAEAYESPCGQVVERPLGIGGDGQTLENMGGTHRWQHGAGGDRIGHYLTSLALRPLPLYRRQEDLLLPSALLRSAS